MDKNKPKEKKKAASWEYRTHPNSPCNQPFNILKKKEEKEQK